jgi:hypothetical protein
MSLARRIRRHGEPRAKRQGQARIRGGVARTSNGEHVAVVEIWTDRNNDATRKRFVTNENFPTEKAAMDHYLLKLRPRLIGQVMMNAERLGCRIEEQRFDENPPREMEET